MKKINTPEINQPIKLEFETPDELPLIYADRIINFGLGTNVCRLTLGTEKSPTKIKATHQLVIPIEQFLEALDFITLAVYDNEEISKKMIEGLENLKIKLQRKRN